MRKFAVCILATMLMLGALPIIGANAAAAVTGPITGLNCSSGMMVIVYNSRGSSMNVSITSSTVITLNGAQSSCEELAVGMRATASGEIQDGILVATSISAQGSTEKTFRLNVKITSLGCPTTLAGLTQYGLLTFDISGASITRNGQGIPCSELQAGESVLVSGKQVGSNYIADTVSAVTAAVDYSIQGTISSVNCPEIVVATAGQSVTVNVGNATININGQPASCSSLKPGMTVAISAQKNGDIITAKMVNAKTQTASFSITGIVLTVACPGDSYILVSTSEGNVMIGIKSATITKNGQTVYCDSISKGDEVSVTGTTDGQNYQASTVTITKSGPQPFTLSGKIKSLACPSIVLETTSGQTMINLAGSEIRINGVASSCTDLKADDQATIVGTVLLGVYKADRVTVSRTVTPPTPPPPNPPNPPDPPKPPDSSTKSITGTVAMVECQQNVVVVDTANGRVNVPLIAPIFKDGVAATCADIKVGDGVTITVEITETTSTIKKFEFTSANDSTIYEVTGTIAAIDCNARMIAVRKSDDSVVSIPLDPACVYLMNGNASSCSALIPGMEVTVVAKIVSSTGNVLGIKVWAKNIPAPEPDTFTGIISSIDCPAGRMKLKIEESEYSVVIAGALISVDGKPETCDKLKTGMKATVKGKVVDTLEMVAMQVDAQSASGTSDCNGKFGITGTVEMTDCINKIIIIKVGSVPFTLKYTDSTIFTYKGQPIDCSKLARGDTVEISGECTPQTGMIAITVEKKESQSQDGSGTLEGTILSISCQTGNMVVSTTAGLPVVFKLYSTTEFYVNGQKVPCSAIAPGMKVKVTYKTENNVKVAVKVEATLGEQGGGGNPPTPPGGGGQPPTPPPGGGGGGGGGNPPPPPPGGSGSGSGSGSAVKVGDPYQSVLTIESYDCSNGTIKGTDEYNSGKKVVVSLVSQAGFFYKQEKIECSKVKPGYLVKVIGKYGSTDATKVNAETIEILPVSPVKFTVFGRIIDINPSTGVVKLEKITNVQSGVPVIQSIATTLPGEVFTLKIDPSTTFEYRGEKLTVKDLRVGVIMNVDGLLDPVNNSIATNNFMLAARQAVAVTETGIVADVFCDKNLFWIAKDNKPDSKYILIRMSAQTEITVNGSKATCADIAKGSSITINGKLDPFDLFVVAESINGQFEKAKTSTVEGEVVSVDTGRGFFWIKIEDGQGVRFIQVKFSDETKILVFGKIGTATDLATVGMVSVTGLPESGNPFVIGASIVETTGKIVENLSATGTVVFADCASKVLFVKTATGVERFELTVSTRLTSGEKISTCADILEGMAVSLTYDKKGTKTVVTKIALPLPKTVIKLTVGLGAMSINGKNQLIDAPPYVKNGTTMVPLRVVSEAFGASNTWNQSDKRITIQKGSKIIICWVGRTDALVGGVTTPMKTPPEQDRSGRTMVPIRFMSELFGADVLWDQASKTITITM